MHMIFIETPIFTKRIAQLLPDENYTALQQALLHRPELGATMPGSGGIKKLRWRLPGGGKRGGVRVIYYWDTPEDVIYMLLIYKKNRQEDLSADQLRVIRRLLEEYLK